jgi:hypothetical protein
MRRRAHSPKEIRFDGSVRIDEVLVEIDRARLQLATGEHTVAIQHGSSSHDAIITGSVSCAAVDNKYPSQELTFLFFSLRTADALTPLATRSASPVSIYSATEVTERCDIYLHHTLSVHKPMAEKGSTLYPSAQGVWTFRI